MYGLKHRKFTAYQLFYTYETRIVSTANDSIIMLGELLINKDMIHKD